MIGRHRLRWVAFVPAVCALLLLSASTASPAPGKHARPHGIRATSPIKHVVIIFQENHSFDDLLGRLCVEIGRAHV